MKKGQLLAALALAFALGVVAPVAGVYNSDVNAAVDVTPPAAETATAAEVATVISTIEAQPEYKAYVALNKANADTATYTSEATAQGAIATALNTFTGSTYDGETTYTATLTAAKSVANYSKWAALVAAMEAADDTTGTVSDQAKAQSIMTEAEKLGFSFDDLDEEDWATNLSEIQTEINKDANYTKYKALINAVDAQEKALAASNTSISNLQTSLAGVGVDNRDINTALNAANPITSLKALAAAKVAAGTRGAKYVALATKIENASIDKDASTGNLTLINGLKADYKDASGSELPGSSNPTDPSDPDTPAVNTIKSADGKVSVTGNIPAGVYVEVSEAKMPENFEGFGELKNAAFDIVLKNADGTVYNVDQTLVVSIAVPEGINGANSDVIYITSMGGTENMKAKYADGFMTFTTNHFSIYAIVERATGDNGGGSNVTPGDTGTVAQAEGTASATGILAGIAAALTAAGAGVVAFRNARRNSKKNA